MISGTKIQLLERTQVGVDNFRRPIYEETPVDVENVLIGIPTPQDGSENLNMTGRRIRFTLGIPKGDEHTWEGARVILPEPFAGTYRVEGIPAVAMLENTPLAWDMKVEVVRCG